MTDEILKKVINALAERSVVKWLEPMIKRHEKGFDIVHSWELP